MSVSMRILYFFSHFYTSLAPDSEAPSGHSEDWGGFSSAVCPAGCGAAAEG